MMIIQSKRVYVDHRFIPAQLEIDEGKIFNILPYNEKKIDIDYGNDRILPGFYDIHTHGYYGYDTTGGDKEGLIRWMEHLPKEGVCGFCPTTLTQSKKLIIESLKTVVEVKKQKLEGTQILGVHLEGPFINTKYKGAQPEKYIIAPSIEIFDEFQDAARGLIKIVTLAPEMDKNFELISYLYFKGVNPSIGHTDATYETCMKAIENGARGYTHTYNAMSPFTHRKNGAVGAAFNSENTYAEIIGDGVHSTFDAIRIFFKQKGMYGIMVTDSLLTKGLPPGTRTKFGGQVIENYPDGSAHLVDGKKSLAGSTLKFNEGLRNLIEYAHVPTKQAIAAVSENPAKYLGLGNHKGKIKESYDCDLVVLDDDYHVIQTYCQGKAML